MRKYKYYVCARDLIHIAHNEMHKVNWRVKIFKCPDAWCDLNSTVEVFISIPNPIKDGKNKSPKQNLVSNRKKRPSAR